MGAIIEAKYDDKDEIMKWPLSVAPYHCAIIPMIKKNDTTNLEKSYKIFKYLKSNKPQEMKLNKDPADIKIKKATKQIAIT